MCVADVGVLLLAGVSVGLADLSVEIECYIYQYICFFFFKGIVVFEYI